MLVFIKALQKTDFFEFFYFANIGIVLFSKFGIVSEITGCFGFVKFLQNLTKILTKLR